MQAKNPLHLGLFKKLKPLQSFPKKAKMKFLQNGRSTPTIAEILTKAPFFQSSVSGIVCQKLTKKDYMKITVIMTFQNKADRMKTIEVGSIYPEIESNGFIKSEEIDRCISLLNVKTPACFPIKTSLRELENAQTSERIAERNGFYGLESQIYPEMYQNLKS
jgi:hypothetical protein